MLYRSLNSYRQAGLLRTYRDPILLNRTLNVFRT